MREDPTLEAGAHQPLRRLHLLYHEIRPHRSQYSYAIETAQFERHLDLFVQMRTSEKFDLWPEITFDDGHISNFEIALPLLQARVLTARFFITAGWTGNKPDYMGWPELRSLLASGQLIGAHGYSHTLLTHCAPEQLEKELRGARLLLEDKLGTSITTMSLPGGRYNQPILRACREAGYSRVYTSEPAAVREPKDYTVGRLNIRGDMTEKWLQDLFQPGSRVLSALDRQYRLKAMTKRLLGDGLYERFWAILNRKESAVVDDQKDAA
ncbi:MAG: polysaccharide deacetylase family protein [Acidobacteriaceae bacterium]